MKCILPDCRDICFKRGLCYRCYRQAEYLVERGLETWGSLIRLEMCLAEGPSESPFTKVFSGAVMLNTDGTDPSKKGRSV